MEIEPHIAVEGTPPSGFARSGSIHEIERLERFFKHVAACRKLTIGDRAAFSETAGEKGPQATYVRLL